jgi:hypothetical protein
VALKDGDEIYIGDTRLIFEVVTETVRHTPPPPKAQGWAQ